MYALMEARDLEYMAAVWVLLFREAGPTEILAVIAYAHNRRRDPRLGSLEGDGKMPPEGTKQ